LRAWRELEQSRRDRVAVPNVLGDPPFEGTGQRTQAKDVMAKD
jgi:hypothetical protein